MESQSVLDAAPSPPETDDAEYFARLQEEARAMGGHAAGCECDACCPYTTRPGQGISDAKAEALELYRTEWTDEDAAVQHALDEIPFVEGYEALEALVAAPPIKEDPQPVRLTRQSARRLAMQLCDLRLKENGVRRAERRRLMFNKRERVFNFSSIARALVAGTVQGIRSNT